MCRCPSPSERARGQAPTLSPLAGRGSSSRGEGEFAGFGVHQGGNERALFGAVEEQRRHGMTVEGIQRLQASQAGRDLIRERAALLASLPENKNKSMTELLQMAAGLPQGAQFESADVRRLKEAEAAWEKGKETLKPSLDLVGKI